MTFLGVDGGGSQTRALLCDESGKILGQSQSGPCNPCTQSPDQCFEQLRDSIQRALASNAPGSISAVHLGVAGAGHPAAREIISTMAGRLFGANNAKVSISHDLKIAHAGGLAGRAGIALVAGTGSACFGADLDGKEILTGGWGDLIDDAGSGSWLGLRALQVSVRQADGRAAGDDLLQNVLRFLNLDSAAQLKAHIHLEGLVRHERAKLARVVLELAQSGDSTARELVEDAFVELSLLVQCNFGKLGLPHAPLVLLGGLNTSTYFREGLGAFIQHKIPNAVMTQPRLSACAGAVLLAMQAGGVRLTEEILAQLAQCP
jgi:N-acetylglucosamine kinase-like BadF-type ATPase